MHNPRGAPDTNCKGIGTEYGGNEGHANNLTGQPGQATGQPGSIPVKEIGKVFPCMLQYMRDTPAGLHILFSKLDISNGFWRLTIREHGSYNFAYVLPQEASELCWIVIPAAVQMGWVESPSLFCTVIEST